MRGSCLALALLALGAAAPAWADTRPPNRIVRRADDRETTIVPGNLPSRKTRQFDQGRVEAGRALARMAIVFKPSAAQQAELEALLAAQQDPNSPSYHHWLTPEEYAARFGMSDADLAEVGGWLGSHGLSVHAPSRSRRELYFSGAAGQVEEAFRTELHDYLVDGELRYANSSDPSIPSAYADVVLGVRRLDNLRPKPHLRRSSVSGHFTSNITGNHFVTPDDFATIYDLKPLYAAGLDGSGQKLAVVGQSALGSHDSISDIAAFRSAAGLPAAKLQQLLVPGTGNSTVCSGDVEESDLDVEWSGAIAQNATVVFVYVGVESGRSCATATSTIWDALEYAIDNDVAPVISTSYGACEAANGTAFDQMVRGWAQQGNAQGQTIAAAAGDSGAADCEDMSSTSSTTGLAVDVPASIPEVTGVGGTEFDDSGNPSAYWAATNDANNGSALQYIPEVGWNDSLAEIQSGGGLASGGGGASDLFAKPSWQVGTGVPADGHRDVPDVAFDASADVDPYLFCTQGDCVNGFRNTDQTLGVVGGTSVAAPTLAGLLTLVAQGTGSSGLGNVNPNLYALASSAPAAFHDITAGDNIVPCVKGSPDCPAKAPFQLGFVAAPGYDQVTGLGSLDADVLAEHWTAKIATTTSVGLSSPSPSLGTTETFTATVAPASSGVGSPAGALVHFTVDGADVGSAPVALVSSAFRAVLSTNTLAAGAHSVDASYAGNLVYLASTSAPVAFEVSDFTISANPTRVTVSPGGSMASSVTVTATDGFTGTVSLSCAPSNPLVEISCSFQPASVTLSAGNPSQTAQLTIGTAAPHVVASNALPLLGGEALALVLLFGLPVERRRRSARAGAGAVLLLLLSSGLSCGGGGGGGGNSGPPPAVPANVAATAGNGQVLLSWTDASTVTHFEVDRATKSGGPYQKVGAPTSASFTDGGLSGGTTYYYVVQAVNADGKSGRSSQVSATPADPGTPDGSYTITVTGTSGATAHNTAVGLTVQ